MERLRGAGVKPTAVRIAVLQVIDASMDGRGIGGRGLWARRATCARASPEPKLLQR